MSEPARWAQAWPAFKHAHNVDVHTRWLYFSWPLSAYWFRFGWARPLRFTRTSLEHLMRWCLSVHRELPQCYVTTQWLTHAKCTCYASSHLSARVCACQSTLSFVSAGGSSLLHFFFFFFFCNRAVNNFISFCHNTFFRNFWKQSMTLVIDTTHSGLQRYLIDYGRVWPSIMLFCLHWYVGQWEAAGTLPTLDACGGHVGNTPARRFSLLGYLSAL